MSQLPYDKDRKNWTTPQLHDVDEGVEDIENGVGGAIDGFNGRSTPTAS